MIRLPEMQNVNTPSTAQTIAFGGINRAMIWKNGELRESKGLSSALYPALSQRSSRVKLTGYTSPTAIFSKGKLCVVDGTDFKYDGVVKGTVTAGAKMFASVNTKIVIFPDKAYYDVAADVFGSLECTYVSGAGQISFTANTIVTTGAAFSFKAGDAVTITGSANNSKTPIIRDISADKKTLTFSDNAFTAGAESGVITIARTVPAFDCICEHDNRLWGAAGQTVYGSALGDPTNFNVYDGTAADSYAVAVGSDGPFTGCMAYASHICFFKENKIHKLYGSKPSNYQLDAYDYAGVMAGSAGSLRIINEIMYFHGRAGVYAYYGGAPDLISEQFGDRRYSEAHGGTDGERYYVSMKYGDAWELMVYDRANGIWLKDSDTNVSDFCTVDGKLYILCADGIYTDGGTESVEWSAELCPFTENVEGKKCVSRLSLRLKLEGSLKVEISRDKGPFETIYTGRQQEAALINIPVKVRRCDEFSLRLSGMGKCIIQSMVRQVAVGSEV